jgi:hypothetical protein
LPVFLKQPGASRPERHDLRPAFRCASHFNESATGTGDLFLRAKWHVVDTWLADIALAEVLTLPTGNADELLGFTSTFTPWFIASKSIGASPRT